MRNTIEFNAAAGSALKDDELLLLAAWLDGRLDERSAAAIETCMADDRELLERVLALRESHSEPVAAAELQRAQALISEPARQPSLLQHLHERIARWLLPTHSWQPAPMAMGAVLTLAVMVGSLWFGTVASQELRGADYETASQLDIAQLDFSFNSSDVE